jgi:hypothetical protein
MAATARAADIDYADVLAMNCVITIDAHNMETAYHCCNFVAAPPATRDGRIMHGRNLDFPHGGVLQEFTVAVLRAPESGAATLAVGWVGFAGLLTGLSGFQMSMAEVGVPARDSRLDGIPIGFAIRSVLERAQSLDDCYDLISGLRRTCGFNLALCDGKTGAACGIETTAGLCERRRAIRGVLVVDDVCMCKNTGENRLSHPAGAFRHARMTQLIAQNYGKIDVETALGFLRDKYDMARGISHGRTYNCICNQDTVQSVLFLPAERKALIAHGKVPAPSGGYTEVEFDSLL